jgi:hypothetical protein
MRQNTRRHALAALVLAAILVTAALSWGVFIKAEYYELVSASDENTAVSFGFTGQVVVTNDGPNDVYVSLVGTTATTSDFQLKMGETLAPEDPTSGIGLICATAESATVRVLALQRGS